MWGVSPDCTTPAAATQDHDGSGTNSPRDGVCAAAVYSDHDDRDGRALAVPLPAGGARTAKLSMNYVLGYVLLGLVAVSLLAGLIALGVGNRGWSWGTVAAAILTLLMAAGYLVVASRMAAYESSWVTFVRDKQTRLAEVRDGLVPEKPGGRLVPAPGTKPLDALADERARWQRAFDRIDSWQSRRWAHCTFEPPVLGDKPRNGTIEIDLAPRPADAAAGDAAAGADPGEPAAQPAEAPPAGAAAGDDAGAGGGAPLDPGAVVYLFDERPIDEGGRYLGAMRVLDVKTDPIRHVCTLEVTPTEPPDAYDRQAWDGGYEKCVSVFDALPGDRWLAFSTTPADADDGGVMPAPARRSIEELETLLAGDEALAAEVERHEVETIDDKDEWPRIRARLDAGEELPGRYWATVKLEKDVTAFGEQLADGVDERAKRELLAGTEAEFDLQTAFTLQEGGFGTIEQVRERRPLRDGGTRLYGGLVGRPARDGDADAIAADGIAGLAAAARREIDQLQESIRQLEAAQASVRGEAEATAKRRESYAADLRSWVRDAAEAERIAAAFDAELRESSTRLKVVTGDVIELGRDLRTAIGALSTRIDAAAPPPVRAAATATP